MNTVSYLKAVCYKFELQELVNVLPSKGSAPISVVDHAIKLKKQAAKEQNEFNRIFIVIDRDSHTTYLQAGNKAAAHKIEVIYCDPCFEFWFLLHFVLITKPINGGEVLKELRQHIPKFNKDTANYGELYQNCLHSRESTALSHAKSLWDQMEKCGAQNPRTNFHELMTYLSGISNRPKQSGLI